MNISWLFRYGIILISCMVIGLVVEVFTHEIYPYYISVIIAFVLQYTYLYYKYYERYGTGKGFVRWLFS